MMGLPFASARIMDRLEAVSAQIKDPHLRLFTGIFPRERGQPCSQILWWKPLPGRFVLIGSEEDIGGIGEPPRRHEATSKSDFSHDGWVGLQVPPIDWSTVG